MADPDEVSFLARRFRLVTVPGIVGVLVPISRLGLVAVRGRVPALALLLVPAPLLPLADPPDVVGALHRVLLVLGLATPLAVTLSFCLTRILRAIGAVRGALVLPLALALALAPGLVAFLTLTGSLPRTLPPGLVASLTLTGSLPRTLAPGLVAALALTLTLASGLVAALALPLTLASGLVAVRSRVAVAVHAGGAFVPRL